MEPDKSLLGALSFFAQHEAYHVGQLRILRNNQARTKSAMPDAG